MSIKPHSNYQNRTVHTANVDEADLHALALKAVAESVGLDPAAQNLVVRIYSTTHQEGSLGTSKPRVVVEIIEDHRDSTAA
ncbi:hypothetical protein JOS77_28210 [Chromobacterium haemolyticum]|nr:hypothetical protein JOS77_28210 [Chromobacterium haemolyticum]